MATTNRLSILSAPSKYDLQLSLFERKEVSFTLEGNVTVNVIVTNVGQEDGSCDSWNVSGCLMDGTLRKFQGFYRTDRRSGHLRLSAA